MKCCLNCTDGKRHPGCHDKCDTFLKERAEEQERKEIIRKAKVKASIYEDIGVDRLRKARAKS